MVNNVNTVSCSGGEISGGGICGGGLLGGVSSGGPSGGGSCLLKVDLELIELPGGLVQVCGHGNGWLMIKPGVD